VNLAFLVRMVAREARAGRRLWVHGMAVALGVAALVAINSFREDLRASIRAQARAILGADLELRRNRPFPDSVQAVLDSAAAAGVPVSYATSFASMALAPSTGMTRLVQVRAVAGDAPYYGAVTTRPPAAWRTLPSGPFALVDPAVLIQLGLEVGDSLRLGDRSFAIVGAITNYPGRVSLAAAIGPRVYIPMAWLDRTNLLRRGSLAFYEASLAIPDEVVLRRFLYRHGRLFERHQVSDDTVDETEDDLTAAFDTMARFLGLVGLTALLLGGLGVASAVHVLVKSRLDAVAVLRCLGARQPTVFGVYLALSVLLGMVGSVVGAAGGLAVQATLPHVLRDFLPLDVAVRVHPAVVGEGLVIGLMTALLFALFPLLGIRNVPPLRAIRRDVDDGARPRDPWRLLAAGALAAGILYACLRQAPEPALGVGFAGAIAATALVLTGTAALLIRATRRLFPGRAAYVVRQGIANLFRPRNQTLPVILALGFGVFLLGTVYVVQQTLLAQFRVDARPDRPNLVMFDIQRDQQQGVRALLTQRGFPVLQETPIVPARLHAISGRTIDEILKTPGAYRYERWALRREYRHTYRDTVVATEEIVAGRWFGSGAGSRESGRADPIAPPTADRQPPTTNLPEISLELDIAADLNVGLGDRITWDVQGVLVETRITSLRRVNWARFEPNFFVVFQPGVLEQAPQMTVTLSRIDDPAARARFQGDLVSRFPNVAAVDLTLFQGTVDLIFRRVSLAVRFMALFSVAAGLLILVGALATSRLQRLREVVLLRTLGARTGQLRAVLFTEYAALGLLAGLAGAILAGGGGWLAARFVFEVPFRNPVLPLAAFSLGAALLTVMVGAGTGRALTRRAPLEVLRDLSE
jgi:putative ABC transport system permease protein